MKLSHLLLNLPRFSRESLLLRHLIPLWHDSRFQLDVSGHLRLIEGLFLFDQALRVPPGGTVVEIGSYLGRSTTFIAAALARIAGFPKVHAVDTFTGIGVPGEDGRSTLLAFQVNTAPYRDLIVIHQAYAHEIAEFWKYPIDMLFIDGDHSFEGCSQDIMAWVRHLSKGGLVCFHDYTNSPDVRRAVDTHFRPWVSKGSMGINGSMFYGRKL